MAGAMNPEIFSTAQVPPVNPQAQVPAVVTAGAPVPAGSVGVGAADVQGAAVRDAAGRALQPEWSESMGAAIKSWHTTQLYDHFTKPDFTPDGSKSHFVMQQALPFVMSEEEESRWAESKSVAERVWLSDQFQSRRQINATAAQYPISNFFAQWLDPIYLGVGGGVGVAAKSFKSAGAATAFGASVEGATVAGVAGSVRDTNPMSNAEYAVQVLLGTAGGALVSRGGKLTPRDPDYPEQQVTQSLKEFYADFVGPAPFGVEVGKPKVRIVSPAEFVDEVIPSKPAEFALKEVPPPRIVETSKPNFGYRETNHALEFASAVDKAAYIVGGKGKSKAHESILEWASDYTGLPKAEIVAMGNAMRSGLRDSFKAGATAGPSGTVLVPKVWAGKPKVSKVKVADEVPASTQRRKVKDAVLETLPPVRRAADMPEALRAVNAGAVPIEDVAKAVDAEVQTTAKSWGERLGASIGWNLNKDFHNLGGTGGAIGDLLVDNNLALSKTSAESIKRGVQADLGQGQAVFETTLRETLANRGYGAFRMAAAHHDTRQAQKLLEQEIAAELVRRNTAHVLGQKIDHTGIRPEIKRLADLHDATMMRAVDELKASGVRGADAIERTPGYFHRVWNSAAFEDMTAAYKAAGLDSKAAHQAVVKFLQKAILRRNADMTPDLAYDIGAGIVNTTLRKGLHTEGPPGANYNAGTLAKIRDELTKAGVRPHNMQRVLDVVAGKVDEAGKLSFLKHRIELDFDSAVTVGTKEFRMLDMIETNLATIMDQYIDKTSGRIGMAAKGLGDASAIAAKREEFIASVARDKRDSAAQLFDQTVNANMGNPVGDRMNQTLRNGAAFNRMITLGASGVWQATEYATPMMKYGMLKTLKYAMRESPPFRALLNSMAAGDKATARRLKDVLTSTSEQNLRLRPYIQRYEDNFDMPMNSRTSAVLQQGAQIVPYLNLMKFVHRHQARVVANLVTDTVAQAAKGNAKAAGMLAKYGLERQVLDKLSSNIKQHGMNVDAWDDAVWLQVRPAVVKMMDEAVLHHRRGDMPAFAQFDNVGKFIFTYRSFVLTAHNKLLAGSLARDGLAATSLMMLYQYPLAMMAVQAQAVSNGKGPLEQDDMLTKALGQMGSLGLLTELAGVLSGSKREFGSPALIPVDRAMRLLQSGQSFTFGEGTGSKLLQDAAALTPLAILPMNKALLHLED